MFLLKAIAIFAAWNAAAYGQDAAPDSGKQAVKIVSIHVKGSRLPESSLLHLTGLRAGQIVDEAAVRTALGHANASGLFKNISYTYESLPDSTDVILNLQVDDQLPLVPATIKIANVDAEKVWQYLETFDPFFTRELPTSDNAIKLYARYMTKYLETVGQTGFAVIGRALGSDQVTGIEFTAVKLRSPGR